MDVAEKAFDEMIAAAFAPYSISDNIMIKGYISSGRDEDGLRLFSIRGEKGLSFSEKTFSALMPGLCDDVATAAEAREALN